MNVDTIKDSITGVSKTISSLTNSVLNNKVHKNTKKKLMKLNQYNNDNNDNNGIELNKFNGGKRLKKNKNTKKKLKKNKNTKKKLTKQKNITKTKKTNKTYLIGGKLTINPMITNEEAREETREEAARERRIAREEAAREAIERRIARRTQKLIIKDNVNPVTNAVIEEYKLRAKNEISIELIHEAELELDSD